MAVCMGALFWILACYRLVTAEPDRTYSSDRAFQNQKRTTALGFYPGIENVVVLPPRTQCPLHDFGSVPVQSSQSE
jgi:hypothetical protein